MSGPGGTATGMGGTPPIVTFAELYRQPEAHTYKDSYAELYAHFVPSANWNHLNKLNMVVGVPTSATNTYVGLFTDPNHATGTTRLLHCPTRYQSLDGSAHNGQVYAILDDMVGTAATWVKFPTDAFRLTRCSHVSTDGAALRSYWTDHPAATIVPPSTDANNSRDYATPNLMYVPAP